MRVAPCHCDLWISCVTGNAAAPDTHRQQAHEQWVAESEQAYTTMSEEEERRQRRVDVRMFTIQAETCINRLLFLSAAKDADSWQNISLTRDAGTVCCRRCSNWKEKQRGAERERQRRRSGGRSWRMQSGSSSRRRCSSSWRQSSKHRRQLQQSLLDGICGAPSRTVGMISAIAGYVSGGAALHGTIATRSIQVWTAASEAAVIAFACHLASSPVTCRSLLVLHHPRPPPPP